MYKTALELPGVADLFPDSYPKGRQCCRSYFFNVFNSLHPAEVQDVIDYANKQRNAVDSDKLKGEAIEISEEWKAELDRLPFVSKQKGRMSALLKKKSKTGIIHKERTKYQLYDFQKRHRDPERRAEAEEKLKKESAPKISIGGKTKIIKPTVLE